MEFYKETSFKETPIGKIPKSWDVVEVEDLGEVITGTTPSTFIKQYWNGRYPFVTPTDITEGKYVEHTERKITEKGLQRARLIPKDSVLVTCIASVGKIALASEPCVTNQQINAVICKEKVNPHHVYYATAFRSDILKTWAGRTTNPIVKKSLFEKFPLALPKSVNEQHRIAEVLSTMDEAIQKTNEVIAKTERLKKGLMQELLTKGIGHKEFKDTEIGRIPKEWVVVKLEQIVEINKESRDPSKESPNEEFLYIDIDSIEGGTGIIGEPKRIIGKNAPSRARRVIHPNNVIMSTVRPYLKAFAMVPKEYDNQICSTGFAVFRNKEGTVPHYLLQTLFSRIVISQCNRMMMGGQYPALNNSQVAEIRMPFPPPREQQKIADILSTVDKKLELERNEKAKLERIKQGLMDLLLTGKIRAKVN